MGADGTVVQTRGEDERLGCTRNEYVNDRAIHVVLAGALDTEKPSRRQVLEAVALVRKLQKEYHVPNGRVIGHREASPTTCPGKYGMQIIDHYFPDDATGKK